MIIRLKFINEGYRGDFCRVISKLSEGVGYQKITRNRKFESIFE